MRKNILMFFMISLTILIIPACSDSDSSTANKKDNEEQSTEEKEDKQTPQEIIAQSNEVMQDWPGMEYTSDIKQTIKIKKKEEKSSIEKNIQMNTRRTFNPMTMEVSGNSASEKVKRPINSYLVDNIMYTKTEGQWIGVENMNSDQLTKQNLGQKPTELMKELQNIIENDNKKNSVVDMEETEKKYIIKLRLDKDISSEMIDEIMNQIEDSLDERFGQVEGKDTLKEMNIKQLDQTYYINNKSLEQSKVEQQIKIAIPVKNATITIDMNMTTNIIGKVEEPVTVPDDIKKNAEIISMEELREAEQPIKN